MESKLSINGILCYAFHGCLEEESRIGANYRVDVRVERDLERAISSDDLNETIDYVIVSRIVHEQMAIRSRLIEHVAGRILSALDAAFPGPKILEVSVTKYNPPVNRAIGEAVITLRRAYK